MNTLRTSTKKTICTKKQPFGKPNMFKLKGNDKSQEKSKRADAEKDNMGNQLEG